MKIKQLLFVTISFFFYFVGYAAQVDTVTTHSTSMKKEIKAVVITPENYLKNSTKQFPVVYLLHGYSGNYAAWLKVKGLLEASDNYDMIIVSADGGYGSWYWDSPIDKKYQYETYISNELLSFIDKNYRTIKNKKGRAIAGLSMGGYGALCLAIQHNEIYGAVGSMSGGVDFRPFPNNWEISLRLGKYNQNKNLWDSLTIKNMLYKIEPKTLKIIIDCGTEDFFFKVNEELHNCLTYYNIEHDYIVKPGNHSWAYWENAIKYQLLFFNEFFKLNTY